MKRFFLLLVLSCWLLGLNCQTRVQTHSTTSNPTYTCSKNEDCVIYCGSHNNCCGALCECRKAFHKKHVAQMKEHCDEIVRKKQQGQNGSCPMADCPKPTHQYKAICQNKQCLPQKSKF